MNKKTPLTADKELYRLWYEFYRLALISDDRTVQRSIRKSQLFYADWKVDAAEHFDDWWSRSRNLFQQREVVRVFESGDRRTSNTILIEIPIKRPRGEVLSEVKTILSAVLPPKSIKTQSSCKYVPSEIQGVKRDALRIMLDLEKRIFRNEKLKGEKLRLRVIKFFNEERYKKRRNSVPASFFSDSFSGASDNVDRNIRRYRLKVKKLILNVATGVFPGKY